MPSSSRSAASCPRAIGPQALLPDLGRAVHAVLAACALRADARHPDRRPRAAGHRRRRARAGRAVDDRRQLPAAKARPGLRRLRHGRRRGADHRPDHRRLDHRRDLLALDLPDQRAVGILALYRRAAFVVDEPRGAAGGDAPLRARRAPDRLGRLPADGDRPRRAADHARPRPDRGLVRQPADPGDGGAGASRPRRHGGLGAQPRRPDRAAGAARRTATSRSARC